MEAALLLMDAIAVVVLVFTSLPNDRLASDEEPTGPFRFIAGQPRRRGSSDPASGLRNDATSRNAIRRK